MAGKIIVSDPIFTWAGARAGVQWAGGTAASSVPGRVAQNLPNIYPQAAGGVAANASRGPCSCK